MEHRPFIFGETGFDRKVIGSVIRSKKAMGEMAISIIHSLSFPNAQQPRQILETLRPDLPTLTYSIAPLLYVRKCLIYRG
jgi:hypothetical protein